MTEDSTPSQSPESIEPSQDRQYSRVKVCAWCQRVESNGEWLHTEQDFLSPPTHGICPECYAKHREALITPNEQIE